MNGPTVPEIPQFDRQFFDGKERFTRIGSGAVGGKGAGLLRIHQLLLASLETDAFPGCAVEIPTLTVLATDMFDAFMQRNALHEDVAEDLPDDRIAGAFQRADLQTELLGDLRALVRQVHQPLAVRSSSLPEDALYRPFAGVYGTKMIPNNQPDPDTRFQRLVDAIKFVYASTFFANARRYLRMTDHRPEDEKMAVLIQEVVGRRHGERFYPDVSGVARSYNFYRFGHARPEDGVATLALGLGKTIVDGGVAWSYSPAWPRAGPPFASARDTLGQTQTAFWAVNMGRPPAHDPIRETEYLVRGDLRDAERDGTLGREQHEERERAVRRRQRHHRRGRCLRRRFHLGLARGAGTGAADGRGPAPGDARWSPRGRPPSARRASPRSWTKARGTPARRPAPPVPR